MTDSYLSFSDERLTQAVRQTGARLAVLIVHHMNKAIGQKAINRAAGSPEPQSSDNPFNDVKAGAYYYKAVLWAAENGITSGMTADTLAPGQNVNRAQIVTFLYRDRVK